jgi:CHAT domain-containing protein
VVTRDGVVAEYRIASSDEVEAAVAGLHFQIETFVYGPELAARKSAYLKRNADRYLARLYDMLLRPVEAALGDRDLVVVPHGALHYVPVHALFDGVRYVVERRSVSFVPSATVLALCAAAPSGEGTSALLCGVPDASAPEIRREVTALRAHFPDATVLEGADATRAAFAREAEGRRVVHVAAHAEFRSDNPMLSCVRLADGRLTFYDIFGLRLDADLVVLSGCNTGAVAVGAGDELHGLLRGFLYAGAPSLLLSLWDADDAATADLMEGFYIALGRGAGKREALREAQLRLVERYPHPYYWAPFLLLGKYT